jgi:hypothetical protein
MSKKKQARCTETIDIEDMIAERKMAEYAEMRDLIEYEKELDQYRRRPEPIQISIVGNPTRGRLKWWEVAIILVVILEVGRVAVHTFANL